jgi:hypothetical protein
MFCTPAIAQTKRPFGRADFTVLYALAYAVCFLRALFPSDCFKETSFAGVLVVLLYESAPANLTLIYQLAGTNIRALTPVDKSGAVLSEQAMRLTQVQEAAFDALDKGFLCRMVLAIYSDEENPNECRLLESYACERYHA